MLPTVTRPDITPIVKRTAGKNIFLSAKLFSMAIHASAARHAALACAETDFAALNVTVKRSPLEVLHDALGVADGLEEFLDPLDAAEACDDEPSLFVSKYVAGAG